MTKSTCYFLGQHYNVMHYLCLFVGTSGIASTYKSCQRLHTFETQRFDMQFIIGRALPHPCAVPYHGNKAPHPCRAAGNARLQVACGAASDDGEPENVRTEKTYPEPEFLESLVRAFSYMHAAVTERVPVLCKTLVATPKIPNTTLLPHKLMTLQARENGIRVVQADPGEDDEDWDDVLEDMEDLWMREPAGNPCFSCIAAR